MTIRIKGVTKDTMNLIFTLGVYAPAFLLADWGYIQGSIGWVLGILFISISQSIDFELDGVVI